MIGRTSTLEQGQSAPAQPRRPHDGELNHGTPADDAPSARLSSPAGHLSRVPFSHARDAAFSFDGSSGDLALLNFVAARVEPGSQSRRDSAESLESSGGLHVHSMRATHGKVREANNSKLSGA